MIELRDDSLQFSFPDVHPAAKFSLDFQRTLRIPDDGTDYPLPAGLGSFPLRHVDDFAARIPQSWRTRGGVMMPMYQAEALWLSFHGSYPIALKVAAGKINTVTGETWRTGLRHGPSPSEEDLTEGSPQDYLVLPDQPWLDGFNVGNGRIRQFVAMPLGEGYTAEEQLTGTAEFGGLQLLAYPMTASAYAEYQERQSRFAHDMLCMNVAYAATPAMGLGLGGTMRQDISSDPHDPDVWDLDHPARCFIHLTNSQQWAAITGEAPPSEPPTADDYQSAGIPWFSYYASGEVVPGSATLAELASVNALGEERGEPLPDNDPIPIDRIVDLTKRPNVRTPDQMWESTDLA